jgi:hypothetical protein
LKALSIELSLFFVKKTALACFGSTSVHSICHAKRGSSSHFLVEQSLVLYKLAITSKHPSTKGALPDVASKFSILIVLFPNQMNLRDIKSIKEFIEVFQKESFILFTNVNGPQTSFFG